MPNLLTGDFEAVLQISGGTINRLLASMHQNAFEKPNLPSFPHSVRMRIGDDHAFEGVRGLVHAQVAVPRVELIHGATDRFSLAVGVRAWFRPDPATEPLPAFIHGTVHAEYRVNDIDPSCLGWSKKADAFLWIRVVRDSVRFQGTAKDDKSIFDLAATVSSSDPAATAAANIAKVTRQIAMVLAKRFEATPHPVSKRFRRGSLRSLNAPIGGSAIALPLGLTGEPWGEVASINNVLLNGTDLAVAVSIGTIMALVNSTLDPIRTFSRSIPVDAAAISTVYHVGVHPPSVQWLPHGSYGVFKVTVNGWANTNSILANASFSIEQDVTLNFDGNLWLAPGSLQVTVHASGIGSGTVANRVKNEVLAAVPPIVQGACSKAKPSLDKMTQQTEELSNQLKSLDSQASIWLDTAEFVIDGLVIRGTVDLSPRRGMVIKQEKTAAEDGHSALESWIPGGRIDRFEWSWTWSGSGDPGNATYHDRFLLRRPWGKVGRWGMAVGLKTPLPGLDGGGIVCLRITGVRVDPVTGQFVTVTGVKRCTRFGIILSERIGKGERLFLRDMPELSQDVPFPQLEELPLIASRRGRDVVGTANTLLIFVGEAWDGETADTLGGGLEACRRYDAGLAVLVLFREGALDAGGLRQMAAIEKHMRRLGIAASVNEDVNGGWSRVLELHAESGEPAWAIIAPDGAALWNHQGRIASQDLATALDIHLRRCRDLRPVAYHPGVEVGMQVAATALHPGLFELVESPCPPVPLGRLGVRETVVTFVQRHSAASAIHLRKLAGQYGQPEDERETVVVVVFDGADALEAEALTNELGLDFVVVADPAGKITDRFGIGVWPTTIKLDRGGIVSEVEIGIAARRDRAVLCRDDGDLRSDAAV